LGGWTNKQRETYRAKCVAQLRAAAGLAGQPTPASPAELLTDEEESNADTNTKLNCPTCGEAALRLIASEPRPSWREALSQRSTHLPGWYRKSLEIDDEKFWDGKFGPGFNAWYLENIFECAYQPTAPTTTRPAIQLMLPGLETQRYYALE
jgi:hypothetical protein